MEIYGNKEALIRLSEYKEQDRMPHSLLFSGDFGTGKKTLAYYTAMLYFCEKNGAVPCMSCLNCERIEKKIHPDVIYVDCENTPVLRLREILKDSCGGSVEGGIRAYILSEFQFFNRESQNALLTYLEEPSDKIRFILTASGKNGILPTILSRTALIRTEAVSEAECAEALVKKDVPKEEAEKLSKIYRGNIGQALKALDNKNAETYLALAKEYGEAVVKNSEYKALATAAKLPQPKEDKREPVRSLITEVSKLFHDALAISAGGKALCGSDEALSRKMAEKYKISVLNELCEVSHYFCEAVTNVYFNSKVTSDAFTARIFEVLQK